MKPRVAHQKTAALTLVEVMVVIVVLVLLVAMLLPKLAAAKKRSGITCVNHLQQIGLSYQIWAGDNGGKYPFEMSVTNGGTKELNFGKNAWLDFLVMSNELSTPKVLVCPQDSKHLPPATNFSSELVGHISYFVGLDAKASNPRSILSGDANFEIGSVPVKSDVLELPMNAVIAWPVDRHKFCGNILFADGRVDQSYNLNTTTCLTNLLHQTGLSTNRLAIP